MALNMADIAHPRSGIRARAAVEPTPLYPITDEADDTVAVNPQADMYPVFGS